MMKRTIVHVIAIVVLCVGLVSAGPNDPIVGEEFEAWIGWKGDAADLADKLFSDSAGYSVLIQPSNLLTGSHLCPVTVCTPLVICPDIESISNALTALKASLSGSGETPVHGDPSTLGNWPCGVIQFHLDNRAASMCNQLGLVTPNLLRTRIWAANTITPYAESTFEPGRPYPDGQRINNYAQAVSDYLYSLDTGWMEAPAPKAIDYGLPDSLDFYAPPPDYVIEGYQNYLNFLNAHDTIRTDFAYGLTEFIPSDSLWDAMKENAPRAAWPNKEWPMLQHEYKKFFERGGDVRVMQTLTHDGFDTLQAGEYFFAVSVAGKVRFGRELRREEVQRIVAETGSKVPRANHAFLFPGEPVLTAGAFFIEETKKGHRLSHINAQSGHYFYSNVSPTIREDISIRSDEYLLTLGHFFIVLDRLGIPHDNVVVSKL